MTISSPNTQKNTDPVAGGCVEEPAAFAADCPAATGEAEAERLWLRVRELLTAAGVAARARNAAGEQIPEALRDGPAYASAASTEPLAEHSGFPVLTDDRPPAAGHRRIRWSPDDLYRTYESLIGVKSAEDAFAWFAEKTAKLRARLKARNLAYEKTSYLRLDVEVGRLLAELDEVQNEILALPCDGPRALAAQLLVRWSLEQDLDAGPGDRPANVSHYACLFRLIAPHVDGPLGQATRNALAAIEKPSAPAASNLSSLGGAVRTHGAGE